MKNSSDQNTSKSIPDRAAGFFAVGGEFAKACASARFPFEIRPQQEKMALTVAEALVDSKHLAVEAGTGIGKTFAYLVPLILSAVENKNRMAVSTHTINLQEQLMFKDIPFLREHMQVDFNAVLCKGRSNYICLRRLESASLMSGDLFNKGREKELSRLRRWAAGTEDGTLSDFTGESAQPSQEVWRQACSEHDNCLGRKCGYYPRCFLMKARAAAADADILILNHHLFFSDLSLRRAGGSFLPEFTAVVLDEAHNLEEVAGEHLGPHLSQGGLQHWLRRLYTPGTGKGLLSALKQFEIADEVGRLWEGVDHFFMEIYALTGQIGNYHVVPDPMGNTENSISDIGLDSRLRGNDRKDRNGARDKYVFKERPDVKTMLTEQIARLVHKLEGLRDAAEDETLKTELNAMIRRGDEIRQTLDFFLKEHDKNYVYWVERESFAGGLHGASRGRLALVSAPIDVAPMLRDMLFNSYSPVILTSATLSVNGSLEFFKKRVGADDCREVILGSPFDYQRRMKVFITEDMPVPNDEKFPGAATKAVAHFIKKTGGRAFVLFTSTELMRYVAKSLKGFFEEENILALVQGEGLPRHVMLEEFQRANGPSERQKAACPSSAREGRRQKVDDGDGGPEIGKAVLFGLDSFWMGVDVRGEALSNVILVRLPFAVPDEPLVRARIDLLAAEGKDAFREYSLPQAILKFRQGVGRLIRTANDEGIIVILDSRIISRWYGKYFLRAIPECPVEKVRVED